MPQPTTGAALFPLAGTGIQTILAILLLAAATAIALAIWTLRKILRWHSGGWLGSYCRASRPAKLAPGTIQDIHFAFIDHFEPNHGDAGPDTQLECVRLWREAYARAIAGQTDSDGFVPQHTWFVQPHELSDDALRTLSEMQSAGWGELQYHLHHDDDPDPGAERLRLRIRRDLERLQQFGGIPTGKYGLVHGMFALCGGDPRYCRSPQEIDLLLDTGCYADFTFPAVGTPAQPRMANSIYYARTNGRLKPYDTGAPSRVGQRGEGLLIIPGPMCFGLFPRVFDDSDVSHDYPPTPRRMHRWLRQRICVPGRPNWLFVHVHSHSAGDSVRQALFDAAMPSLWSAVSQLTQGWNHLPARVHYVTARESYNIIRAAEDGLDGNSAQYRDYEVPRPYASIAKATETRVST